MTKLTGPALSGSTRPSRRDLLRAVAGSAGLGALPALGRARAPEGDSASDRRFEWFDAARLGLFVHWGPYSLAGVEASWPLMVPGLRKVLPQPAISESQYVALAQRFDPRSFDADEWVRRARDTGMRYIILTSKHHDGYCLFDAPGTDYKVTRSPYGRDLCAELAEACAKTEVKLGFYFSPPDLHDPGYRDTGEPASSNWTGEPERPEWSGFLDRMEAQLRKLMTDYGDIAVLWFDGLFDHERYEPERMVGVVRELGPETLVNDRLGPGDYVTPEQFFPSGIPVKRQGPPPQVTEEALVGFFDLLLSDRPAEEIEQLLAFAQRSRFPTETLPSDDDFQRWETCLTMNRSWAYNPSDTEWKSSDQLIRTLIEVASRGGNLLLNVGPTPEGTFPPQALERLEAVGRFTSKYGESIYGTTFGPVQGHERVRSTERDGVVYLHVVEDGASDLAIAGYDRPVSKVRRVSDGAALEFRHDDQGLRIERTTDSNAATTVIALEP